MSPVLAYIRVTEVTIETINQQFSEKLRRSFKDTTVLMVFSDSSKTHLDEKILLLQHDKNNDSVSYPGNQWAAIFVLIRKRV